MTINQTQVDQTYDLPSGKSQVFYPFGGFAPSQVEPIPDPPLVPITETVTFFTALAPPTVVLASATVITVTEDAPPAIPEIAVSVTPVEALFPNTSGSGTSPEPEPDCDDRPETGMLYPRG